MIARCPVVCGVLLLAGCSNQKTPPALDKPPPIKDAQGETTTSPEAGGDSASGPVCPMGFSFGAAMNVPGIGAGDKTFAAITPDELTIAWVLSSGKVLVADRTDPSQPFGNPQTVPGTYQYDRVALSSDGLTLIVVLPMGTGLGQLTRASRSQPFSGNPDTAPFSMLLTFGGEEDAGMPEAGMATAAIGDPVLSNDGKLLFFSVYDQNNDGSIAVSEKVGTKWLKPVTLTQPELDPMNGKRRHPTGLSSDGLTLFFWDEVDSKEKAAWRKTNTSFDFVFSMFVDLADRKDAQPSASCTRLYFSSPAMPPQDVKFAQRM
jgi:hypothetical protein